MYVFKRLSGLEGKTERSAPRWQQQLGLGLADARNSIQVSHMGWQEPKPLGKLPLLSQARDGGSRAAGIQTGAPTWNVCLAKGLNPLLA